MSITNCPECGHQISTQASACPQCGYDFKLAKKAKSRKGCGIALLALLGFFFLIVNLSQPSAEEAKIEAENKIQKEKALKEKHCKISWSEINDIQKKEVLNEFMDSNSSAMRSNLQTVIRNAVKYPATLEFTGDLLSDIKNVGKGIIEYQMAFESENKLGMKVKGHAWYTIKYTAGCKNYEIVSLNIE